MKIPLVLKFIMLTFCYVTMVFPEEGTSVTRSLIILAVKEGRIYNFNVVYQYNELENTFSIYRRQYYRFPDQGMAKHTFHEEINKCIRSRLPIDEKSFFDTQYNAQIYVIVYNSKVDDNRVWPKNVDLKKFKTTLNDLKKLMDVPYTIKELSLREEALSYYLSPTHGDNFKDLTFGMKMYILEDRIIFGGSSLKEGRSSITFSNGHIKHNINSNSYKCNGLKNMQTLARLKLIQNSNLVENTVLAKHIIKISDPCLLNKPDIIMFKSATTNVCYSNKVTEQYSKMIYDLVPEFNTAKCSKLLSDVLDDTNLCTNEEECLSKNLDLPREMFHNFPSFELYHNLIYDDLAMQSITFDQLPNVIFSKCVQQPNDTVVLDIDYICLMLVYLQTLIEKYHPGSQENIPQVSFQNIYMMKMYGLVFFDQRIHMLEISASKTDSSIIASSSTYSVIQSIVLARTDSATSDSIAIASSSAYSIATDSSVPDSISTDSSVPDSIAIASSSAYSIATDSSVPASIAIASSSAYSIATDSATFVSTPTPSSIVDSSAVDSATSASSRADSISIEKTESPSSIITEYEPSFIHPSSMEMLLYKTKPRPWWVISKNKRFIIQIATIGLTAASILMINMMISMAIIVSRKPVSRKPTPNCYQMSKSRERNQTK